MAMSTKDRRALIIGVSAVALFLLAQFMLFPLLDKRKRLERGIQAKEKGLVTMQEMQSSYTQLSSRSNTLGQRVGQRPTSFGLFSFLEKKAAEAQVKENIS